MYSMSEVVQEIPSKVLDLDEEHHMHHDKLSLSTHALAKNIVRVQCSLKFRQTYWPVSVSMLLQDEPIVHELIQLIHLLRLVFPVPVIIMILYNRIQNIFSILPHSGQCHALVPTFH